LHADSLTLRLEPGLWVLPTGLALLGAVLGVLAGIEPMLAVAGAAAVALLLLTISSLIIGVVGFIALSFLELVPNLAGPALSLAKLAGLLLAISWFAGVAVGRYRRLFPSEHAWLTFLMLGFITWNLVTVAWAAELPRVVTSSTSFLLNFALFPIVYSAVRTTRDARWIILAFIAGASFAALYAIVFQPNAIALATSPSAASGLNRLAGTVGDPNELAALLAAGVALCSALVFNPKAGAFRAFGVAAALLMLVGVFLTLSRGGLIALLAILVGAILFAGGRRAAALGGACVVAVVGLVFFFGVASPDARERVTANDGGSGRTDIWNVGWRMVADEPIVGVGSGNFQNNAIHYLLAPGAVRFDEYLVDVPSVAHNAYLQVLAETGLIGLLLFLAIIAACVAAAVRAQHLFREVQDREGELISTAVILAICALLAAYFFLSEQQSKHLWLLLSLGPALLAAAQAKRDVDEPA
jgi:O-antigen ligase